MRESVNIALLAVFAVAELTGCATAPTKCLSIVHRRVDFDHNGHETITRELNSPEFLSALAKATSIDSRSLQGLQLQSTEELGRFEAGFFSQTDALPKRAWGRATDLIRIYVSDRYAGHTRAYCQQALEERCNTNAMPADTVRDRLLQLDQSIADAYLHSLEPELGRRLAWSLADATNTTYFAIRDGDATWLVTVYCLAKELTADSLWQQVDKQGVSPLDLDPKMHNVLEAATRQAEDLVKKEGLWGQLGACHSLWEHKKQILKEEHNLDWRSPAELNPCRIYD